METQGSVRGTGKVLLCSRSQMLVLTEVVSTLSGNPNDREPLEVFWQKHQLRDGGQRSSQETSPAISPQAPRSRERMRESPATSANGTNGSHGPLHSGASGFSTGNHLLNLSNHPASSLPIFLNIFGPLVFPLYRAALLRKRILFVGDAPVEEACHFGEFPSTLSVLTGHSMMKQLIDAKNINSIHSVSSVYFTVFYHILRSS